MPAFAYWFGSYLMDLRKLERKTPRTRKGEQKLAEICRHAPPRGPVVIPLHFKNNVITMTCL